jgi:chromosome segregation and condensation protein ScpB
MNKREIVEALIFSGSGSISVKDILKALPETTQGGAGGPGVRAKQDVR